jgi:hypothetical protein
MSAKHTFMAWDFKTESAGVKLVLLQIANNSNDDGVSWYSIDKMADSCGMGVRTFQRHLNFLESEKVIEVVRRPNKTSVYKLVWMNYQSEESGTANLAPRNCQNGTSRGAKMAHDLNNEPNKESNNSFVCSLFEKFWKNYNCEKTAKVKKQDAKKAFLRLMRGKSDKKAEMITYAMLTHYQDNLVGVVFGADRMHPTTYINKRQWQDDPEFMEKFEQQWEKDNEQPV